MKCSYKILFSALFLWGCYSDKGYEPKIDYTGAVPTYKAGGPSKLSTCNKKLEGTTVYVEGYQMSGIYTCSDGAWTKIADVAAYETKYENLPEFDAESERKYNALNGNDVAPPVFDQITDSRDQHVYKIVRIDGEWWFAENLDFEVGESEHYEDNVCKDKCGVGYYYDDAVHACPRGFHLSTRKEWKNLIEYVGGEDYAAIALKAEGDYWYGEARNTVGFSALPVEIDFYSENCFWTATDNVLFDISGYEVQEGSNVASQRKCSVRCVGD
ncbi:major paralogous domain-containing protein [Fibrobacter sp. UWB15]|jgi:uncharacterized protein (TIGR02145 family)|nr:major paralogous domain-containing protein [Fibrobacter sp. UWB8]SMG17337.1 major paralogous domain-containing protein [Fibrobacter sp. UWB15]